MSSLTMNFDGTAHVEITAWAGKPSLVVRRMESREVFVDERVIAQDDWNDDDNRPGDLLVCIPMERAMSHLLQVRDGAVWFLISPENKDRFDEAPNSFVYTVKGLGGYSPWGHTNELSTAREIAGRAHSEGVDVGIRINATGEYIK